MTIYVSPVVQLPIQSLESTTLGAMISIHSLFTNVYHVSQDRWAYNVPLSIDGNNTVVIWFHVWIPVYHPTNCAWDFVGVAMPDHATTHVVSAAYFFIVVAVLHPFESYVILHALLLFTNQFSCTPHLFG